MTKRVINDSTLEAIADAIRAKTGDSGTMTPLEMPDEIADIPTGGGGDTINDVILAKTATSYINNTFDSQIPNSAFYYADSLQVCKIPNATKVNDHAFYHCNNLTTVDFSEVKTVDNYGFNYAFAQNSDVSFPELTGAAKDAFSNTGFKSFNAPKLAELSQSVFANSKLETITLKQDLGSVGFSSFSYCANLTSIIFDCDITGSIYAQAFYRCTSCILYDFRKCTSVPTLVNVNAFDRINANAKIVVPDSLYNDWIAASNWVTYASYIIKKTDYDAL